MAMSIEEPSDRAERDPRLLRVSHADRDRTVEILRDAAADGRLDTDEHEERVELALTARTFADLEPLTVDLPVAAPAPPAVRETAAAAPAADGEVVRWQVAGQRLVREGAWLVPLVIDLDVAGGSARLDYTLARLPEGGHSTLRVSTHGGSVRLTVPPTIAVDLSGVSTHGGRVRDNASRRAVPGAVTHVITVTGSTHGGSVRVEPSDPK
jgi:hypothetical protein